MNPKSEPSAFLIGACDVVLATSAFVEIDVAHVFEVEVAGLIDLWVAYSHTIVACLVYGFVYPVDSGPHGLFLVAVRRGVLKAEGGD